MTIFDSKPALIASICQQIYGRTARKNKYLDVFTEHFFKRVPIEYLQKMLLPEVTSIVQEMWTLFQVRQANESLVKIIEYPLSHHAMSRLGIFMVNLDQPFLIDSITTFLEKRGHKIEIIVHPVLGVQRTKEGRLVSLVDLKETHTNIAVHHNHQLTDNTPKKKAVKGNKRISAQTATQPSHRPESIAFIQIKSTLTKKQIDQLKKEISKLILQVRNVVSDWPLIKKRITALMGSFSELPLGNNFPSYTERNELKNLLNWFEHGHFIFLGSRYFSINRIQKQKKGLPSIHFETIANQPHLGLFRDVTFVNNGDLAPVLNRTRLNSDKNKDYALTLPTLSITKSNARSTVHRASRIDSIEVIDWDNDGNPRGLYQFIGIFTQAAFTGSAFDIPIIGEKVHTVFNQFGFEPQWHDGKTLISILNSIPRDELFYLANDQIYEISQNVLNMNDRHSLILTIRPDAYGRYITVMVFLPKEKYSYALKDRFSKILEHHLKGKISSDNVLLGELDYARLILVVSFSEPRVVTYNEMDIQKALLEAALSWEDYLERLINTRYNEKDTALLLTRYQKAFPTTYIDAFKPEQALVDIGYIEKITDSEPIDLYLYREKEQKSLKIKIFHARHSLSLSTLLPILQNLGFQVIGETTYSLERDGYLIWIHDFEVHAFGIENWKTNHNKIITAFHHIWNGTAENDVLYQLILKAGLNVRQVTLIRAYLKFLRQVQLPYSLAYLQEILTQYPDVARNFIDLFELRFALKRSKSNLQEQALILKDINRHLEKVDRIDHDRILRRVLNAIEATVRTNFFQTSSPKSLKNLEPKPYLAFKFDCRKLDDLPHPSPLYEIFIYSPRVEAIHLRGAKVARGGIRWSDRPEDFRTEILGLMKAQTVKNSVIVPVGSKGGFIVKNQGKFTNYSQMMGEVISCYQMMIRGMLDLTDNLVKGKVIHPPQVMRFDEDDPYLVVAADKGTAEFSDIANAISNEYNFWLDDAFASGGSTGYDHKKIGITARGVWESVKAHFRALKHDYQTTPFSVIGIGDMSGDVFGNGMLQSNKIRLLAAFNHQHIFLDPDPDTKISFDERKRLFEIPHSSWSDYNTDLISVGGGVFERSLKSIKLSPQCRKIFGLNMSEISPDELIKHLLCQPADLLYFGGIGTFVKATTELHTDVGDRANNDIRVDAKSLQAKIIAEGANLGMTQRARIEFALKGGLLNTDAIDNSAGVDCSDHEVNLKILFNTLGNSISRNERNELLKEMTDNVAKLVLTDNYRQTQILTVLEAAKSSDINTYQSLMRLLESDVGLDRTLEALPDDETLEQRRAKNQGLTRPELSILLAYSKIFLYEKILASKIPDDSHYNGWLHKYFPDIIQARFPKAINAHPLRREITATVLVNEIINRVGPVFIYDITQACGVHEVEVVKAFFLACETLDLHKIWDQVDSLDPLMVVDLQTQVLIDMNQSLKQIVLWFLRHPDVKPSRFIHLHNILPQIPDGLHGDQRHIYDMRKQGFLHMGVSLDIAQNLSLIPFLPAILDIMFLGKKYHNLPAVTHTYFSLRSKIGLDWLDFQAAQFHGDYEWQRSARTILIDDLAQIQVKLTASVMTEEHQNNVDAWIHRHKESIHHIRPILANIKSSGHSDLGMLSYAMRQLERLI
ncbi:MAG: NAD-glutamate dehydrogenase [Alphaproteobacteria bacterium]|nr:NAD-glutamate dehydrogenase [Alphaproteobacteria bacterium]